MGWLGFIGVLVMLAGIGAGGAAANPANDGGGRDGKDRLNWGGAEEAKIVYDIRLEGEFGRRDITSVMILSNTGSVLGASTKSGVRREDEDRVALEDMPLLGGLFGGDDDDDEYYGPPPRLRIGTVYLLGRILALDLGAGTQVRPLDVSAFEAEAGQGTDSVQSVIETRIAEVSRAGNAETGIGYDWQDRPTEVTEFKLLNTSYSYALPGMKFLHIGYVKESPAAEGGRIPVLGDVPLLGALFRQPVGDAYLERRSLIVLVEPSIRAGDYQD